VSFGSAHVDMPLHDLEGPTPPWAKEVVSGHPTQLIVGQPWGSPGDPLCTNRNPRTALGLTADHRALFALVVDGRRAGAAGFTCDGMAYAMALEGAFAAVALDGGEGATLVVDGQVKYRPSGGQQRRTGNHLAFSATGSGPAPQCPDYADPICEGSANLQRCAGPSGTFITSCEDGAAIAHGDCGFFGAGCSLQGGLAHGVHPSCLQSLAGGEDGSFCVDATKIATGTLGRYEAVDCGAFGALCSEAGGNDTDAHCVHRLCHSNLDGGENGTCCKDPTTLATCTFGADVARACVAAGGAARRGEDPETPPPPSDAGVPDDADAGVVDAGSPDDADAGVSDDGGDDHAAADRPVLPPAVSAGCAAGAASPVVALLGLGLVAFGRRRRGRRGLSG